MGADAPCHSVNGCRGTMLILWTAFIAAATAHKVYESTEDIGPEAFLNVTTLYPIQNNTQYYTTTTTETTKDFTTKTINITETKVDNDSSSTEMDAKDVKNKLDATVWKIDAAFADSNDDKQKENNTDQDVGSKKNDTKIFKPSQHLGSFYDEDDIIDVTATKSSFQPHKPLKPSSGFVSSITKDHHVNKIPKQLLHTHHMYPYKFETPILTRLKDPWRSKGLHGDSLESIPTVEAPVKVPAGGLYKYQDPFQEKPASELTDDFGLEFTDAKDNPIKKRENPWESLLRLVTAFLPVGLIISALTPSIITVESTGAGPSGQTYPSNLYRRSDPGTDLPAISERCRRRLLCELHSDAHYSSVQTGVPRRGKHCHKIRCDDSAALARTLKFLLDYRLHNNNNRHGSYK